MVIVRVKLVLVKTRKGTHPLTPPKRGIIHDPPCNPLKSPLTKGDFVVSSVERFRGLCFPGLFPIPRFHEDEFHENKFTTPYPPPLSPSGGGQGEEVGFFA